MLTLFFGLVFFIAGRPLGASNHPLEILNCLEDELVFKSEIYDSIRFKKESKKDIAVSICLQKFPEFKKAYRHIDLKTRIGNMFDDFLNSKNISEFVDFFINYSRYEENWRSLYLISSQIFSEKIKKKYLENIYFTNPKVSKFLNDVIYNEVTFKFENIDPILHRAYNYGNCNIIFNPPRSLQMWLSDFIHELSHCNSMNLSRRQKLKSDWSESDWIDAYIYEEWRALYLTRYILNDGLIDQYLELKNTYQPTEYLGNDPYIRKLINDEIRRINYLFSTGKIDDSILFSHSR